MGWITAPCMSSPRLNTEQTLDFLLEIAQERSSTERLSADLLHQLLPIHRADQGPDPRGSPLAQLLLLACGNELGQGSQISLHGFAELGADQMP